MVAIPDNSGKSSHHQEHSKIQNKPSFTCLLTPLKKTFHNSVVFVCRNTKTKRHSIPQVIPNPMIYK